MNTNHDDLIRNEVVAIMFAQFPGDLSQDWRATEVRTEESCSRRLLENLREFCESRIRFVRLNGTSAAHSALVSCQSDRRCRENESSRYTERNASRRCIDTKREPVYEREFWHQFSRYIFVRIFEIAASKGRSLDTG